MPRNGPRAGPRRPPRAVDPQEGIIAYLKKGGKHALPEPFPYEEARALFVTPEVADTSAVELKWTEPDVEGLLQYLVEEKQFDEGRVRKAIERRCGAVEKGAAAPRAVAALATARRPHDGRRAPHEHHHCREHGQPRSKSATTNRSKAGLPACHPRAPLTWL